MDHQFPTASSNSDTARLQRGRRALLRAGAGSAPVLLTLASTPVSAGTCVVASSFVSVATFKSRNPGVTSIQCTSAGVPEGLISECTANPTAAPYTQLVSSRLGWTNNCPYNNDTLAKVLQLSGTSPSQIGELGVLQHLLAFSIALEKGLVSAPGSVSTGYLSSIWVNFMSNGGMKYELPLAGISWTPTQLIQWLRMCMYMNDMTGM